MRAQGKRQKLNGQAWQEMAVSRSISTKRGRSKANLKKEVKLRGPAGLQT